MQQYRHKLRPTGHLPHARIAGSAVKAPVGAWHATSYWLGCLAEDTGAEGGSKRGSETDKDRDKRTSGLEFAEVGEVGKLLKSGPRLSRWHCHEFAGSGAGSVTEPGAEWATL